MFKTIRAELGRRGWTMRDLSRKTNIQYDSLRNKMTGRTEFTLAEMLRVKTCLAPDIPLDELFATEEDKAV